MISATVTLESLKYSEFDNIIVPRAIEGKTPTELASDLTILEYTDLNDPHNTTKRLQNAIDIWSEYTVNAPMISTANAHSSAVSSTYVYQFSAAPPKRLIAIPPELEGPDVARHSDEMPFLFGFTENIRKYWNFSENSIEPKDYQLSLEIITMWTNFAKSGNPNIPKKLNTLNGETWPAYDGNGEMYLEIASKQSKIKQRLRAEQVVFWNYLLPEMQTFAKQKP
ncbi:acetylcholinesterase-like [Mercenaria mercenaria]|uniref:acetylcholinesterase-like n=1 Tax=Mercenaria mercenaria TaxID=6596 RepID=UPI00234F9E38|nr:acetylcholinesterase-like [Mercenaria mercenaria]